jgi:hypothetical protein
LAGRLAEQPSEHDGACGLVGNGAQVVAGVVIGGIPVAAPIEGVAIAGIPVAGPIEAVAIAGSAVEDAVAEAIVGVARPGGVVGNGDWIAAIAIAQIPVVEPVDTVAIAGRPEPLS